MYLHHHMTCAYKAVKQLSCAAYPNKMPVYICVTGGLIFKRIALTRQENEIRKHQRDCGVYWESDGFSGRQIASFPPIASRSSRVLILGTMPGRVSLRERQYYAHPQNAFWPIVGGIVGFEPTIPYRDRVALVQSARIAVWDVLKSCVRENSLDSAIEASSVVPNHFATFLAEHPQIRRICFNGSAAQALFLRHVRPRLAAGPEIEYLRLPSTSPANASWSLPDKVAGVAAGHRPGRSSRARQPAAETVPRPRVNGRCASRRDWRVGGAIRAASRPGHGA